MKILQVNCVYHNGSTGKIVYDIHEELQNRGFDSVVCYGRGDKVDEPNVYKTCSELYSKLNNLWSRVTGIMYGGLSLSTRRLIKIIEHVKPDIVHLHCINGYFVNIYKIVEYLKEKQIKTVLSLHAEFMHTANCGYAFECDKWKNGCGNCPRNKEVTKSIFFDHTNLSWKMMKKAFEGFGSNIIVTSVSSWLMNRAKQSPILSDLEHCVVLNGLNADIFRYRKFEEEYYKFKECYEGIIFHATPFFSNDPNHIKGGYYVIELAKSMPNYHFLVAGNYDKNMDVPSNVTLLGRLANQEILAEFYSISDITILTSKKETFSMVTAESLCCGTPIVGFKAGAPETISLPEYSSWIDFGDIDSLRRAVLDVLSLNIDKKFLSNIAKGIYDKQVMANNYIDVYKCLLNNSTN